MHLLYCNYFMKHPIIPVYISDDTKINGLKKSIRRKRQKLQLLMEKVELLKMELDGIQHIYNARIGWLYIKDNKLDLEIIKYKTITDFVSQGLSLAEAIKKVENSYYSKLL